jgi:hypothetical protein
MITQNEKRKMSEYLIDRLREQYEVTQKIVNLGNTYVNYLLLSPNQAVLLIDQHLPADGIEAACSVLHNNQVNPIQNVGMIVYKDGETFFRSAAQYGFKKKLAGKLLDYSKEDIHRMMQLTPEEIFISHKLDGRIQYYQPKSTKLEESIMQYIVRPVDPAQGGRITNLGFSSPLIGFHPSDHILTPEHEYDSPLQMFGRLLVPMPDDTQTSEIEK